MNILFTSSGIRVELLKLAKKTLEKFGGRVVAADTCSDAPTSKFCDVFEKIAPISSTDYIGQLLDICKRNSVEILVPTIDTELEILSENADKFGKIGVLVNISAPNVVKICHDKLLTQRFFEDNGVNVPRAIEPNEIPPSADFPLFIKPRTGSSSVNTFRIDTPGQLEFFRSYVDRPIVQKLVEGEEYTVDAFCGFDSKPVTIVPRRRIAVRAGEILKGKIVADREIIDAVKDILAKLKPFGHITLQCIKNADGIFFIEINPRFGGGAPMSIMAGANSIENLIRLKTGEKLGYNENWRSDIAFSRFDDSVIVDG